MLFDPLMARLNDLLNPPGTTEEETISISALEADYRETRRAAVAVIVDISGVDPTWGGGVTWYEGIVTINVFSSSALTVREVADTIRKSFNRYAGELTSDIGVVQMVLSSEQQDKDNLDVLAVSQQYRTEWHYTGG